MGKTAILIVENESIVAADLSIKLTQLGYQVVGVAAQSDTAVQMAVDFRPHLVLMDIQLDGSPDGIATAELMRTRHDVPIIYLTAHSDAATLSRAKLTGPFGYILKPFEERDLAIQIELALYRHQADRKLREQREWLHGTLNSIGDAVIATDAQGRITFLNPVAEELTGWHRTEAVAKPVQEIFCIVNEKTGATADDPVSRVLQTGKIVGLANHTVLLRKGGGRIPIEDSGAPIRDDHRNILGVVLVFRDIGERRQDQAALKLLNETLEERIAERTALAEARAIQLRNLTAELIEAEESERRRLADLLHDDLQQLLAAARMNLQEVKASGASAETLSYVGQLLEESITKSRRLSYELSPPVLHNCGLVDTLQWLALQMDEQFGLKVDLETDLKTPFEYEPLKRFLFRVVQEILFNVVKHAGVKRARITLSCLNDELCVTISDQGRGFCPEMLPSPSAKTGLGLARVRERIHAIGGRLAIESALGEGSRFTLTVPLSPTTTTAPSSR
jgi:PAS domain S-box-containing protein